MKHFKRFLAVSLALILLFCLSACGETSETPRTPDAVEYTGDKISVTLSNTAADYGFAKLLDSDIYKISFSDDLLGSLTSDLAVVPLWRAAELAASDSSIKVLAVTSFGQSSVVTNGVEIGGVKDLDGKTITVGQAYPASAASMSRVFDQSAGIVQAVLDKYGVKATVESDLLVIVYDKITAGSIQIAVLPEPYASLSAVKSDAKVAFTLTNAWSDAGIEEPLVENCIIAKASFVEKNPDGVKKILSDLRASVEWVNLHPADAVDLLIEKGLTDESILQVDPDLSDKKQESAKSQQAIDLIARSNIILMEGESMRSAANAALDSSFPDNAFYLAS